MSGMIRVMILTGAGISAESGIPTFRDENGLWAGADPDEVSSAEGLARDPWKVIRFYNERRAQIRTAKPNAGHVALAELAKHPAFDVRLVTQNIDPLHELASSPQVHHLHGEVLKQRCIACDEISERLDDIKPGESCPHCGEVNTLRPHIVLFGEIPLDFDGAMLHAHRCQIFISIGTSGMVYPAAQLGQIARSSGALTLCANTKPEERAYLFDHFIHGPVTLTLPKLTKMMMDEPELNAITLKLAQFTSVE